MTAGGGDDDRDHRPGRPADGPARPDVPWWYDRRGVSGASGAGGPYGPPAPYGPHRPSGPGSGWGAYSPGRPTNGLAIASLILGAMWLYWVGSILALVFGYAARRQIVERGEQGSGLATAGIVLGWTGLAFLTVMLTVLGVTIPGVTVSYR